MNINEFVKKHWPEAMHIGSGSSGSAHKLGDKVIKITTSLHEARSAILLKKNPHPLAARIYSVYHIENQYWLIVRAYATQAYYSYTYCAPLINKLFTHVYKIAGKAYGTDTYEGNWGTINNKPVCFDVDMIIPVLAVKIPLFRKGRHANH